MEDSDIDAPIRDSIMAQRAFNCNKKEECYNLIKVLSVGISKQIDVDSKLLSNMGVENEMSKSILKR